MAGCGEAAGAASGVESDLTDPAAEIVVTTGWIEAAVDGGWVEFGVEELSTETCARCGSREGSDGSAGAGIEFEGGRGSEVVVPDLGLGGIWAAAKGVAPSPGCPLMLIPGFDGTVWLVPRVGALGADVLGLVGVAGDWAMVGMVENGGGVAGAGMAGAAGGAVGAVAIGELSGAARDNARGAAVAD